MKGKPNSSHGRSSELSKNSTGSSSTTPLSNHPNKCANCDKRIKQQDKEVVNCKNCGVFYICTFCSKDHPHTGKGTGRCPFCENFPRKSKYNSGFVDQNKYQGEIRSRSKNHNDSSIRAKLRKYTNVRVLQKNLVYVIGLSPELVLEEDSTETLKGKAYFGQYGTLKKIVVNTSYVYKPKGSAGPSYGAYVTYSCSKEAALAILGIEQHEMDNRLLRASFGTTKYCSFFLKEQKCLNKECLYLHKWHCDSETYTKEEMASKKIFSDQQEIAIRLAEINVKSKEEFIKSCDKKGTGKVFEDSKFPNIIQIYDKFSSYNEKLESEKSTPKRLSSKAEGLDDNLDSSKTLEEVKSPSDLLLSESKTGAKLTKQERLQQQAQIDIENKILEANNIAISKEAKREVSGNNKARNKNTSPNKTGKGDSADPTRGQGHHNPHIQLKDPRLREGEDKRAISSGRQNNYTVPAHSPSARQPTTAEKYTLFGHSEDSNICKTPLTNPAFSNPLYVISPYLFNRNRESRFEFARSMDPKEETVCLNIPEQIQEILERNIRTMSNKAHKSSIDNTSSTDIIDFREDWTFAMDKLRFENEKMLQFTSSRRSSPRNKQHRHNLSPRSCIQQKAGSLNKRDGENYMMCSTSNQLYSRSSMHSYAEGVNSEAVNFKYDSESTSNNDYHPEHIKYGAEVNERSTRGRR